MNRRTSANNENIRINGGKSLKHGGGRDSSSANRVHCGGTGRIKGRLPFSMLHMTSCLFFLTSGSYMVMQ
jgi:hypothetical protein